MTVKNALALWRTVFIGTLWAIATVIHALYLLARGRV